MRPFRLAPLAAAVVAVFAASECFALPTGAEIRAGQGAVTSPGVKSVVVRQDSARLAIDWQSFGIAAGESVRFVQPGASSIALNRVLGNSRSEIFGNLSANGQVFLINPNGVLFGRTAQVDVGGLIASTLDISPGDFMAGRTTFSGASAGAVINQGRLSAASGGYVALLGPVVRNEGVIEARMGTVALAAGDQVTLNLGGNSLVGLSVDRGVVGALAENQQLIQAEGGRVLLSARAADDVIRAVVNNTGVIEANSVSNINGLVRLEGLGASTVLASGTLRARGEEAGETGGRVEMLGERVGLLSGALIDASGSAGGGVVLVGGDFQGKNPDVRNAVRTYVGPDAAIRADAIERGNGGKVVVWSDDVTRFYGSISARGGAKSGDGGFAEVSGKGDLVYRGNVSLSAPNGRGGTLLLDPTNIDLVAAGGDLDGFLPDVFAADAGSTLTVGALTGIASGTILLEATNNVNFGLDVTLQAGVNLTVTPNSDAAGGGAFNLSANLSANVLNVNGPLNHTAGTLTAASGSIGGLYDYGSAGALTINGGTLTLNGGMNWTGAGGISGVGVAPTLAIPAGQTLSMTGPGFKSISSLAVNNAGTMVLNMGLGGGLAFGPGSSLSNSGLFEFQGSSNLLSGAGLTVTNTSTGTIRNATGTLTPVSVFALNNNSGGTLSESSTGELRLQPIIANYAGTTTLLGDNVTLYSGTHNFATGSVVDGQLNLQSGATANFIGTTQTNGAFNNASNSLLTINGGTLTLNGGMNWGGSGNIVGVGASPRLSVAAGQTLNVSAAGAKSITGAALVLDNAVLQTGGATALTVGGAATVLGSSTVTTGTGSVTFGSTVDGPGSLSATSSGAGFVAFSGAIGSTTPLNNLSVTSDQPVTLPQTTLSGDLAITAAGQIGQSGPLSVGGTSSFNAGTQPIDLSLAGNDFQGAVSVPGASSVSLFDQNALALGSISASGVITAQATTDLSIGAGATIATPAAGNSIVLVAGGDFVNSAGAGALSAPSGRWLVYSTSPAGSAENGLTAAAGSAQPRIYNRSFAANPPATIAEPGSHLVYSAQPSVTVTANNASRPYGDPNPAFSAGFSGFVNDDGVLDSAASAGISGAPAFVAPGGNLTVAGSPYAITPGLGTLASSNGYAFAFVDGQLTVTQRPVTVTADAGQSKVYGNADPGAYTFANTSLGTGVALVGALDRAAGENVGNYAIGQGTLTNAGNPNYLITYVGDNFGITQRPVTVTADPGQSKLFGSPDPVFSFTNTSLGSGVALAGALSRTPGESGGSYPILEGTLTNANNPNYLLTYVGDSFTIVGGPPPVVASSDISERMRVAIVDADQQHRDRRAGEDRAGRRSAYRLEDGGIRLPEGER